MIERVPLSVVITTYNEAANLERCLDSVQPWAGEIFIVDSFSTDRTLEIASRYTNAVHQHRYEGHPQQWRWALDNLPFAFGWVLALDADFEVTAELAAAIANAVRSGDPRINGYYVRHRQIFRGRFLRHGTLYPRYWLRLFRRDKVYIDLDELVDVHFYVDGKLGRLEYDLVEENRKEGEIAFWLEKHIRFAERQATEELRRQTGRISPRVKPSFFGTPDERTLWFKQRWRSMPSYLRPFVLFFYRYVFRLGFLDGKAGFLYHFTEALFYRLLVDVRIEELAASEGATPSDVGRGRDGPDRTAATASDEVNG